MAISVNFNGATLRKPGAYSKTTVLLSGGFRAAPAGIVGIVGEAEGGAPGSAVDIKLNSFSPEQLSEIVSTYKSGPIVDACSILFSPSADARIANGAQQIYIYKTNASTQASGTLPTAYGTVKSLNYGQSENLINFSVDAAAAEAKFSLTFNWIPDATSASTFKARVNGAAEVSTAQLADATPATARAALNGLTGLSATGGTDRATVSAVSGSLALASVGNVVTITRSGATAVWEVIPTAGDTLHIPTGSVLAGAGSANLGGYLVTAADASTITAVKLGDPSTACANVVATPIAAVTDIKCYSPIVLSVSAATPAGDGSNLEVYDGAAAVSIDETMFGGSDRGVLSSAKVTDASTIGVAVTGTSGVFTISTAYAATPSAGDVLWVRPGSPLAGGALQNVGAWRVTAAGSATITATKVSGAPVTVAPADIAATTDLQVFKGFVSTTAIPILNVSTAEASVSLTVNRQSDAVTETSGAVGGVFALYVGYLGTTATLTISATTLSTSVAGGTGANLSLRLSDFATLNDLATYINSQTGYSCAVANALYGQLPPSALDRVSAVGIASGVATDKPGRVKKDSYDVQAFYNASQLVSLTRSLFAGVPVATTVPVFLSAGALGGSTAAAVQAGLDALQKVRVNSVVPLFSRDATSDILDGLTDASSTYTIDAVNAGLKTHLLLMSNTKNRSERNGYASYKGTYADSKTKANTLASERVSLCIQDVKILKTTGVLAYVQPWGMACVAAGMQAGAAIGEPMTRKSINVSGVTHADFDPATQGDDAIANGILYAEQPESGFRIEVGNTTYGKDSNFVYNRISVLYAADTFAYNLRKLYDALFVGTAAATPVAVQNATIGYAAAAKDAGWIVGDDTNEGLGYKNLVVTQSGNVISVSIVITPVQGVDFLLPSIQLDNIRASA